MDHSIITLPTHPAYPTTPMNGWIRTLSVILFLCIHIFLSSVLVINQHCVHKQVYFYTHFSDYVYSRYIIYNDTFIITEKMVNTNIKKTTIL